jgi:hypothetical protein
MWLITLMPVAMVLNVAVTAVAPVIVTAHVPVPVHAPVHPANVDPDPGVGVAVRVTEVPLPNDALQAVPQLIPAGRLVTVPVPLPAKLTVSVAPNVAVTDVLPVMVTVQVPVPLQPPPDHPENPDPALGVAVSVTEVPLLNSALQTEPQLIPAGLLVTVPLPESTTVSAGDADTAVNNAVTETFPSKLSVQGPVPLHAPLQPAKVEFAAGVAVRVMEVPGLKAALQAVPQLIPAGSLVTVPLPVPESARANSGEAENVAETVMFALRVRVQVLDPLQAPPQFTKLDPGFAVAVSVTAVPAGKLLLHVVPHLMPLGLLTTAPLPLACTVS